MAVLTEDQPSRLPDILRRTAPWVRLMAVILFSASGLMMLGGLLFALGVGLARSLAPGQSSPSLDAVPAVFAGLIYLAFGGINMFPATFLWRFANRSKQYVASPNAATLEQALDAQRSYWKFMGIFTVIAMGCAVLVAVIAVVAGVFFALRAAR